MKIVSKDFHKFTGVYTAIYMDPCRRSYILLVRKFRTSKMLDKWSPTSKLSNIKCSHYLDGRYIFFSCTRTPLSAISVKPVFLYLQIFSLHINRILGRSFLGCFFWEAIFWIWSLTFFCFVMISFFETLSKTLGK